MHLLIGLASVLGIEAEELLERLRKNAVAWALVGLFGLIGGTFLLVAAHAALSEWLGPVWAPLVIAALALLVAFGVFLGLRTRTAVTTRQDTKRRHSAERTALVTTAAMTVAPMLLKSSLIRRLGIPLGGALAAAYLLAKSGRRQSGSPRDDDFRSGF